MIKASNIYKKYGNVEVLKGVDISINKGEVACIVGASGAGKSTLLQIIGTLETADKGNVIIDNQDIKTLNQKKLASFRNKNIGFVFQFHHLLPEFTALENICIPAFIAGTQKKVATEKAMQLLEYMNLTDRKDHKPSMMSGGEQQRIAVARALINNPSIVLADEPSGNLDSQSAKELHQLFFNLRDKLGQTFVIVTHNPQLAEMSDKTFTMKDGIII
ncbi:MAG: ABC transporter ATP-binding protein [Bacteroidales bacterium]|nr:ABC transporter ATP-binding protein [Lentimicrobiaceae bacterium]MBQ2853221.1 ABC transporter ATP-binding protein [Bacteroidales bacterium]